MENKSNSVDTFIKFILAGKTASHQLQLFTSKPKSKLTIAATLQLHIPNRNNSTTALAVNLLFIKLQISVHVGIEFYITLVNFICEAKSVPKEDVLSVIICSLKDCNGPQLFPHSVKVFVFNT